MADGSARMRAHNPAIIPSQPLKETALATASQQSDLMLNRSLRGRMFHSVGSPLERIAPEFTIGSHEDVAVRESGVRSGERMFK